MLPATATGTFRQHAWHSPHEVALNSRCVVFVSQNLIVAGPDGKALDVPKVGPSGFICRKLRRASLSVLCKAEDENGFANGTGRGP